MSYLLPSPMLELELEVDDVGATIATEEVDIESSTGDINCGITTSSFSIEVDVWPGPRTTFENDN
jgi:hypothetical protein